MAETPDFSTMSKEEFANWFMTTEDTSAWRAGATRMLDDAKFVQVDVDGKPLQLVSVKIPGDVVAKLDQLAGRDREGRSGIIRQAVQEYLDRHFATEAEAA